MGREARYEIEEIELTWGRVAYRLKRSRRRTVSLTVDPEAGLVVYSPLRLARARLEEVLHGNAHWILEKTRQAEVRRARLPRVIWGPGAWLPWRGAYYPLEVRREGRKRDLRLDGGRLGMTLPARFDFEENGEALRGHFEAACRAAAREIVAARVGHFQELVGVRPRSVRIKGQKRRWGSCSPRGILNLNWRLILAPPAVLDYVVVHELCHLAHLDHSPRFWARVAAILPGHRTQQDWLREHGPALYAY